MHITVQGTHRIRVHPERAAVHLVVVAEAGTRGQAIAEATRAANELAEQLSALAGVESHTVDPLRVHAWRPSDQNGRRLPERVSAQVDLRATFTDFGQLADFTAEAGGRPSVQVGSVSWSLTEETRGRIEAEALTQAIGRARRRAVAMATVDGGQDVEIVEIADPGLLGGQVVGAEPGVMRQFARSAEAGSVHLLPEDVEVTEVVHVRFHVVERAARPRRSQ